MRKFLFALALLPLTATAQVNVSQDGIIVGNIEVSASGIKIGEAINVDAGGIQVNGAADTHNTSEVVITTQTEGTYKPTQLAGKRFVNTELTGQDFSGQDLSYAEFINTDISNVNFTGANLTGAKFTNGDITYSNMSNAVLTNVCFVNVDISDSQMISTDLSGSAMVNSDFTNVDFTNALRDYILPKGSRCKDISH